MYCRQLSITTLNYYLFLVESYNLMHNQWVPRPSLNRKKGSLAGVSVMEKLFAIGGGNGAECFSEVEMFDMNVGKWIFTQPMQQKVFNYILPTKI